MIFPGSVVFELLQSLLVAAVLGFVLPLPVIGGILGLAAIASYLPGIESAAVSLFAQMGYFLTIFGGGSELQGVIAISLTCAFVCMLLDGFVFYQNQRWHRRL